ncbi:leukocyte elastase inhibitor-like [Ptychodera flava]|uniref:leukocyte elastase inhibitor-like n=1 Tax=Ptychodera flava TaxID=63121 RepID=UPI00396A620B
MEARIFALIVVLFSASVLTASEVSHDVLRLAKRSNNFALNLYRSLSRSRYGDNVFFSPVSISTALAMVHLGAEGNTSTQISDVLQLHGYEENDIHSAFKDLTSLLYAPDGLYTLKSANRLFGQDSYEFLKQFLDATAAYYNAKLKPVDFARKTEEARMLINNWVEEQTEGKIKDLITPGALDPMTVLVLVNAIYFKGTWASKFMDEATMPTEFHTSQEETTEVPMMHQKGKFKYKYDRSLNCDVLELPYKSHQLSMVVILPREMEGLDQVESRLDADKLNSWAKKMANTTVIVSIPKFKMTQSFVLNDQLAALGMSDLFRAGVANLSGISDDRRLYVSKIIHKSFVEVNEEGTEAAAATAAVMRSRMMDMTLQFNANHPFIFLIRDNRSGTILFMGRYSNPPTDGNGRDEL